MPAGSRSAAEALRPFLEHEALGQLVRFAVAGAGVTLLCAGIYLVAAVPLHMAPLLANALCHLVGVAIGFAVHRRWSFRAAEADRAMMLRFLLAAIAGWLLNSLWVWLATDALHLPAWTPVTAMVFVTPLGSFALNRWWVFRG